MKDENTQFELKFVEAKAKKLDVSPAQLIEYCKSSNLVWSETFRHIHGQPFTLRNYPYLEDIYADQAKEIVVIKSAQSGLSEWFVSNIFWFAWSGRGNPYFVFPKAKDCSIFVQGRIDSVIDENAFLKRYLKGRTDNVAIKRFKERNLYFTGSQKRTQIISSPADMVLMDEFDEHNPSVQETVMKRLNNSRFKWVRKISTPTLSETGIHTEYLKSDQRVWMVRCHDCDRDIRVSGDDTDTRFKDFIGYDSQKDIHYYKCPNCDSPDFDPASNDGFWKVQYPGNSVHGYSINRMMTKTCSAEELHSISVNTDNWAEFLRSDLGVPYTPAGARVYIKDCKKCEDESIGIILSGKRRMDYFFGIDIGKEIHVIGAETSKNNKLDIIYAKTFGNLDKAEADIFSNFDPKAVGVDYRPEPTKVKEFHDRHNQVMGCEHNSSIITPTTPTGKEDHVIGYSRYFSIERLYNMILSEALAFAYELNDYTRKELYNHICTYAKKSSYTTNGQEKNDYVPLIGEGKKPKDHYLFATIYTLAAYDYYQHKMSQRGESGIIIV
jgi:hypothetical protein